MRNWLLIGLVVAGGACRASAGASGAGAGASGARPDATSDRWRALVGCYQMEDGQFVLDSVPDLKLNADRPGVRRALFAPQPAIVGGYWYVTEGGAVRLVRHDGLWGRSYEFAVKGDTLVGSQWLRTDVPDARNPPRPAAAVRTASCRTQPPPASPPGR